MDAEERALLAACMLGRPLRTRKQRRRYPGQLCRHPNVAAGVVDGRHRLQSSDRHRTDDVVAHE